jgi:hypothetical protein
LQKQKQEQLRRRKRFSSKVYNDSLE